MEKEKFAGVEILKENVKVKIKDGEDFLYKRYGVKDIVIIKDVEKEVDDIEVDDPEELKELEELEKLD